MSADAGGIAVVRPDEILAFATRLDQGRDLHEYFAGILQLGS